MKNHSRVAICKCRQFSCFVMCKKIWTNRFLVSDSFTMKSRHHVERQRARDPRPKVWVLRLCVRLGLTMLCPFFHFTLLTLLHQLIDFFVHSDSNLDGICCPKMPASGAVTPRPTEYEPNSPFTLSEACSQQSIVICQDGVSNDHVFQSGLLCMRY